MAGGRVSRTRSLGPARITANVAVELRAAELVALANSGTPDRFSTFGHGEYDFFVHGDWPAHTAFPSDPSTPDEWAGLLGHIIDHHDREAP